jgi:S-adenosyl-L-methionine hydrolase (adenosine-forming)
VARPVIALLTDFGIRDHYVGTMKGVMLGICGEATLVDITHDVPPHDVLAGALELAAAFMYFPPGTIFLAVVDPGVGSSRPAVAVETAGFRFVAPDNGVLTAVLARHAPARAIELTESRYARPTISRTFEGRDRFAPAAAWLATGVDLAALGRPAGDLQRLDIPQPHADADDIRGQVLRVDRFGNLITNIDRATFDRVIGNGTADVRIGPHAVPAFVSTYAEAPSGGICALFGSSDHVEVAANGGSAAEALRVERGAPVHITRRA